ERQPRCPQVLRIVREINPDLVVRDEDGKVTTVRYEAVNAMLLNEFLKEHGESHCGTSPGGGTSSHDTGAERPRYNAAKANREAYCRAAKSEQRG
ncbi:MAG TPA: hypothetical protein VGG52_04425, partial [Chthoniobacterales bacterium]